MKKISGLACGCTINATGSVTTNKQEQQKQMIQTENKDKKVQRNSLSWWLIGIMILIVIGILGWAILRFKRYL